ncbi:MAG: tetratricopeptide repeat protein [Armatimonadetes bacterium]|nr:tetratricopeptide repeat protein [Armatimonadota bacterium]
MARSCRCFGLVLCLLIGLPLSQVCAQTSDDFTTGVRLYQDGEYSNAAKALDAATQADPQLESAWYFLGMARYKLQEYPQALAAFEKSLALAPTRPGTRLMIGRLYEVTEAYEQAAQVYQDELRFRRGKDVLPVLCAIGRSLYLAKRPADALAPLQKVIAEDPRYVEVAYYLGLCHHALGKYETAVECFKSALETMDQWRTEARRRDMLQAQASGGQLTPEQQRLLGETREKLAQDYGRAEEFGTELRLWPALNLALGESQLALGNWTMARNAYRKAMDPEQGGTPSDPEATTRVARAYFYDARSLFVDEGMLLQAVGVLDEAIAQCKGPSKGESRAALEVNPNFAPAHIVLGEIYLFQAQTYVTRADLGVISHTCEEALAEFQAALKSDPSNVTALSNAAQCLLLLDRPAEARTLLDQALALEPKNAGLHAQMAQVLLAQEDANAAMAEAQTALSLDKRNVSALNTAGRIYMYYREDLAEAIQHYSEAIEADPRNWETYANLGLAFFQMESWHRARREFQRALDLIPTATIANTAQQQAYLYYLIARTYHQAGMYEQEIAALNDALGRYPSHLDTLRQLAMAYEGLKEYRAAEQVLTDALELSSGLQDDADINLQLGAMYEAEGRPHEAVVAYTAALQADPNSLTAQRALERLRGQ